MSDTIKRVTPREIAEMILGEQAYADTHFVRATEYDAETERLRARVEALKETLGLLVDHQNGCPLPSYEEEWSRAMESAKTLLGGGAMSTSSTYGEPILPADDVVARIDALIPRDGTGMPMLWVTRSVHTSILLAARNEIERLRAGGCARGQRTTQYCAEAVDALSEADRLRARVAALEKRSKKPA